LSSSSLQVAAAGAPRMTTTPEASSGSGHEHDLVIRNAFIVDGSGAPGYHGAKLHTVVDIGLQSAVCCLQAAVAPSSSCCHGHALMKGPRFLVGEIAVRDGVISAVGVAGTVRRSGQTEIDANSKLVTPGWVDVHSVRCVSA
jgi:N-acyl-D-aspartate/D-glutamate deacylase